MSLSIRPVCRDFAPDSLGDDPRICIACLWSVEDHTTPFALGWFDGYEALATGVTFDNDPGSRRSIEYDRGRTQGETDRAR